MRLPHVSQSAACGIDSPQTSLLSEVGGAQFRQRASPSSSPYPTSSSRQAWAHAHGKDKEQTRKQKPASANQASDCIRFAAVPGPISESE